MSDNLGHPPPPDAAPDRQSPRPRGLLPPEFIDLVTPALKVGAVTGGVGIVAGFATGIVRDAPPVLFSLAAGAQCFVLGTSYWVSRSGLEQAWTRSPGQESLSRADMVKISSMSGTVAGLTGGVLRGPRNILPGMAAWTLYGGVGQFAVHKYEDWRVYREGEKESSFASKWSPLRRMTDQEYIDLMQKRILKVDMDIAAIDAKIAEAKANMDQPHALADDVCPKPEK